MNGSLLAYEGQNRVNCIGTVKTDIYEFKHFYTLLKKRLAIFDEKQNMFEVFKPSF